MPAKRNPTEVTAAKVVLTKQAAGAPAAAAVVAKKSVVAPVVAAAPEPAVVAPVVATAPEEVVNEQPTAAEPGPEKVKVTKRRQRPKLRPFGELLKEIQLHVDTCYKSVQTIARSLKSLELAHNRDVHDTKSRENTTRTPTIVFDQALVDYFRTRLSGAGQMTIQHKGDGKDGQEKVPVDLSTLSTSTRVHRTDVTQLYTKVFQLHKMTQPDDGRFIIYQNDPQLVSLLTTGSYKPELEDEVQQIRAGTFKLSIFNIQRFTNHHLDRVKVEKTKPADADAVAVPAAVEASA